MTENEERMMTLQKIECVTDFWTGRSCYLDTSDTEGSVWRFVDDNSRVPRH